MEEGFHLGSLKRNVLASHATADGAVPLLKEEQDSAREPNVPTSITVFIKQDDNSPICVMISLTESQMTSANLTSSQDSVAASRK